MTTQRNWLIVVLLCISAVALSQEKRIFFYSEFAPSTLLYKNGARNVAKANYDVANRKLMYMQGDQLMELLSPELIDTLYMGGSRWIYRDRQFCEVIDREHVGRVLVGWHITKVHEGYVGAYGTSQVPSHKVQLTDQFGMGEIAGNTGGMYNGTFGVNQYDGNGSNLDVWKVKNQSTYYFTKNNREYAVKGLKSIGKAFPEYKEQIKTFTREHKIDMTTAEGALQIIDYLMGL